MRPTSLHPAIEFPLSVSIELAEAARFTAQLPYDIGRPGSAQQRHAGPIGHPGGDYLTINPKGYVPALELDNGEILTEGPTIVQYLADLKPETGLAPPAGTMARYRLQEMLGYINSEIHKAYSPLFKPDTPAETRAERQEYLLKRYALIDRRLQGRQYLFGDEFTVADAYLFTVTNWARAIKLDLSKFAHLQAFQERVAARPAVRAAMQVEGLIK